MHAAVEVEGFFLLKLFYIIIGSDLVWVDDRLVD